MLQAFNDTARPVDAPPTLTAWVERAAEAHAGSAALVAATDRLTYAELNARANRLAHWLAANGAGPECTVGVAIPRSIEMVVAVLGILKAGAAYVPLDPRLPVERRATMIARAVPVLVLTDRRSRAEWPADARLVDVADVAAETAACPSTNPASVALPETIAYVLFTSGSTGTPHPVAVPHRAVVNHLAWAQRALPLDARDTALHKYALSFDASVVELFQPLGCGARVILAPEEPIDSRDLVELVRVHGVTVLDLPPALLEHLFEPGGLGAYRGLRRVICGGDVLPAALAARVRAELGAEVLNAYGPTEATISTTVGRAEAALDASVSIGKPIDNVRAYVLDDGLEPVAVGVTGQLYIGGAGLARGYAGDAALTAARFVPDPFGVGSRLYRTGDLVRWQPDGALEFERRRDHQVKLRGYRIELGEIDALLARYPAPSESVTVLRDAAGERHLVTYVRGTIDPSRVKEWLRARLPDYMVPTWIVTVDAFPRTASGKVDRQALPAPPAARDETAPRDEIEGLVAGAMSAVLGVPRVSRDANFFELGGHSLSATRLVARLREACGVDIGVRVVFEEPTVTGLATAIERLRVGEQTRGEPPLTRMASGAPSLLSFAQEALWFIDRLQGGSAVYNCSLMVRVSGVLVVEALNAALAAVVARHDVLRTHFEMVDGTARQIVEPPRPVVMQEEDRRGETPSSTDAVLSAEVPAAFDLTAGPLLRLRLLRVGDASWILSAVVHHAICDGWSIGILIREIAEAYEAALQGRAPGWSPLPVQYADYATWQRGWLQGTAREREVEYWRGTLAGAPTTLTLPTDRPRPAVRNGAGASLDIAIDAATARQIAARARADGVTLHMLVTAAWAVVLSRVSGQRDLVLGTVTAGRQAAELEGLIGLFVNALPLRICLGPAESFRSLLRHVRETAIDALTHQALPFEQLVEALQPARERGQHPLFQAMVVVQNTPHTAVRLPGLEAVPVKSPDPFARFDLTLMVSESGDGLGGRLIYDSTLFDQSTIARWAALFVSTLQALLQNPEQSIGTMMLVPLDESVSTGRSLATSTSAVHERIDAIASDRATAVAIRCGDERITYAELTARSAALAHRLRAQGARQERTVAIVLERGTDFVIAALAVLKAGAAYLPWSPRIPLHRSRTAFDAAGVSGIVTSRAHEAITAPLGVPTLWVDEAATTESEGERIHDRPRIDPGNAAYVIFTSGSTGQPKGVAVDHRALTNLVDWHIAHYPSAIGSHLASPTFDAAVWEMWPPLVSGGTLHVLPYEGSLAPSDLKQWLIESQTACAFVPTPLAEQLIDLEWGGDVPLKQLLTGGDAFRRRPSRPVPFDIVNHYGVTEAAVVSTAGPLEFPAHGWCGSIGAPIANGCVYVLDAALAPVPSGTIGEIYVGGAGVARGYVGDPALTAARFVPDPFTPGARLYRTGDRGRWLPTGGLAFEGRRDHQVKLRGYRIELGEIDAAVRAHAECEDSVTVVRDDGGERRLVTYVRGTLEPPAVRAWLQSRLPEHMLPSVIVPIDRLPLTASGKVDRAALPAPAAPHAVARAPQGALEELVATVMAHVLHVPAVPRDADFFGLGGHSLRAMKLVSRLREACGVDVPVRIVFERPTVAALAEVVARGRAAADTAGARPPLTPAPRGEGLPLSFAQERLWFIDQWEPGRATYNCAAAIDLRGALIADALADAVDAVIARHDVLRTHFTVVEGIPRQVVSPSAVRLIEEDCRGETPQAVDGLVAREVETPFDLSRGPLIRTRLVRAADDHWVLIVTAHHAVCDGGSVAIFVREVADAYESATAGTELPWTPLGLRVSDYAAWQRAWLQGSSRDRHVDYWRQQLAGAPTELALPRDRPRPAAPAFAAASVRVALDAQTSAGLAALARSEGTTLYMLIVALWSIVLGRASGQQDVVIGTPVAGRPDVALEGLIGLFVNMLPLRLRLRPSQTFRECLRGVRGTILDGLDHEALPFEQLVAALQPERHSSRHPIFQSVVTLRNRQSDRVQLAGVGGAWRNLASATAKYDLLLALSESPDGLVGTVEYASELFDQSRIEGWVEQFTGTIRDVISDVEQPVGELAALSDAARTKVVSTFNATSVSVEGPSTIDGWFARIVSEHGARVAVTADAESLTYAELEARATALARWLRSRGVGPERLVGIAIDRSVAQIVALVAIVKAGGAYLPLDAREPLARRAQLIAETKPVLVLADAAARDAEWPADLAVVDVATCATPDQATDPWPVLDGANLAYVLFTSGTTGTPKAVGVSHQSVVRLVHGQHYATFGADHVWLVAAPLAFDASTLELWGALLHGGQLALVPPGPLDLPELIATLTRRQVTSAWLTAGLSTEVVAAALDDLGSLRQLLTGGDVVPPELVQRLRRRWPSLRLVNGYGPTEATTFTCCHSIAEAGDEPLPIGGPIANARVYILDAAMNPVDVDTVGEIYAGGLGVARGYVTDPALTAARFVPDPFGTGERVYRTGDRGRWQPDGTVRFEGRRDRQIKLRGYRVELDEIDAVVRRYGPDVEGVTVARDLAVGRHVVTYVRGAPADAVQSWLRTQLPAYLVPMAVVAVDRFPLTATGKIDRAALPAPSASAIAPPDEAPATGVEVTLARIWSEVLGVPAVGRGANFFALGGHSLVATRIVARTRAAFAIELPLRALFEHPTLAEMARDVEARIIADLEQTAAATVVSKPRRRRRPRGADAD